MNPTLKDVAERAGVDVSTASRVINGNSFRVRENTRQRVLVAARELGYQPNALARSLRVGRSNMFALLVPDITNPFFAELSKGAEDATSSYGYSLILCNTEDRADTEEEYVRALRERQIDGFLMATGGASDSSVQRLVEAKCPFVLVNRRMQGVKAGYVIANDTTGAKQAVSHLINLGHRRIAHITGMKTADTARKRREAYIATMKARGLATEAAGLMVEGDFTYKGGQEAMAQLLDLPSPPTAVFASNDVMALGAMATIRCRNLHVPEDIAVVGFNDIVLAKLSHPSLTTVRTPIFEMGALAAQMLVKLVKGEDINPTGIILRTELVIRGSCGAALAASSE